MRFLFLFLFCIALVGATIPDFKTQQLKNNRVKEAYSSKEKEVTNLLQEKKNSTKTLELFIRVFKKDERLEVWGKNKADAKFQLIKNYSICNSSGILGPKRKMGDGQTPEGFYMINVFNPNSSYHLSLGINYPNKSDLFFSKRQNPGNNIFIHGACVTIGCIPLTDENIKEVYLLAVEARNNGQLNIPVHIFPAQLDASFFENTVSENNARLIGFWKNLKPGFDYFESHKTIPAISVDGAGKYILQ